MSRLTGVLRMQAVVQRINRCGARRAQAATGSGGDGECRRLLHEPRCSRFSWRWDAQVVFCKGI